MNFYTRTLYLLEFYFLLHLFPFFSSFLLQWVVCTDPMFVMTFFFYYFLQV